jgi:hypothetical protein
MNYKLSLSLCVLSVISYIDWAAGSSISYSIFYFIPLLFIAIQNECTLKYILINAIFALISWNVVRYFNNQNIVNTELVLNNIIRVFLYISMPYLIMVNRKQKNELEIKNNELALSNTEENKFLGLAAHDIRGSASAFENRSDLSL